MSRKIKLVETNQGGIYRLKALTNVPPGIVIDGGVIDFHERYNEDNLRLLFEECPKMQIDLEVECR
jgi:hypothetical protein